jgi:hypothetical protein
LSTLTNLQPIETYSSDDYDPMQNHLRELWFLCHPRGFSYAIFDGHHKKTLYYNNFEVPDFFEISPPTFEELLNNIDIFLNDFKNIKILFESPYYTLMPAALFEEAEAEACYSLKYTLGEQEVLLNQRIPDFGAQILYAVQKTTLNILLDKFTDSSIRERVRIFHHAHALLSGLYYRTNHLNKEVCYVNLCERTFDVVLIKNSALHFCNTYNYNNMEDVLYFVMHAYQSNQLKPDAYECHLSGYHEEFMAIKDLLHTYIKNIKTIQLDNTPSSYVNPSTIFLLQHCV